MSTTITWNGTLTALSSLAHGGETRGTITLLRRELIALPSGDLAHIPVISGNGLRGRLRRVGEELLRDVLHYDGELSASAAHALRGGGALTKSTSEPLSGSRLKQLRTLVPHIAVFGAAGGGCIIDGSLDVGKVVPLVAETNHITGAAATISAFEATQLETYTRQDDSESHDFTLLSTQPAPPDMHNADLPTSSTTQQMLYRVETFPAGTTFAVWLRLRRANDLEITYFEDVLQAFMADGRIGGRIGTGHGRLKLDLHRTPDGAGGAASTNWRALAHENRAAILAALESLA